MVRQLHGNEPNAKADNVQQAVRVAESTKLYSGADLHSSVVRNLRSGMMLSPIGDKVDVWWKVSDELATWAGWC